MLKIKMNHRFVNIISLIIGIILLFASVALARPIMSTLLTERSLKNSGDAFIHALFYARKEALQGKVAVAVCPRNHAGTDCDYTRQDFKHGWIIYADYNANQTLDIHHTQVSKAQRDAILKQHAKLPLGDNLVNLSDRLSNQVYYQKNGMLKHTIHFLSEVGTEEKRKITVSIAGKPRVSYQK